MADFTQEQVTQASNDLWLEWRQRARTDLIFLCNDVLGYPDASHRIHGGLINTLQRFKGGTDTFPVKVDGSHYTPFVPNIYDLEGPRDNLIMFPRDALKSTIVTIAHSIQWHINYPYVRILLNTAVNQQAVKFLERIENHWRHNEILRWLFPELAPKGNVLEWGNKDQFILPRVTAAVEPSMAIATVGAVVSGGHYDVHKYDDLVDKENVRTPEQIEVVKSHIGLMEPLVQKFMIDKMNPAICAKYGNRGWRDMVGTRYHFVDAYGCIIEDENRRKVNIEDATQRTKKLCEEKQMSPEETEAAIKKEVAKLPRPEWNIYVQSALLKGRSAFDREAVAFWPERLSLEFLRKIERDPFAGEEVASSQYYLNPLPSKSGLVESIDQIKFIPRHVIGAILPTLRLHCTVDLHGMENNLRADNDYTVLTVVGFGRDGRPYVPEIRRGRFNPLEVIHHIFDLYAKYPKMVDFKIQKDHFARVLMPFLERERATRQKFPNVVAVPINNQVSKTQKIKGLQPWIRNGDLKFADDLECKLDLINEIMYFPKYAHDDILDTLADHLQNAEGDFNSDVIPNPRYDATQMTQERIFKKFIGFDEQGEPMFSGDQPKNEAYSPMTGVI